MFLRVAVAAFATVTLLTSTAAFAASDVSNSGTGQNRLVTSQTSVIATTQTVSLLSGAISGGFSGGGGGTLAGPHAGGGGSYNAGAFQQNLPGIHVGHGCVTILAIPAPTGAPLPGQTPRSAHPFALASDDSGLATAEASRSENSLAGRGYM